MCCINIHLTINPPTFNKYCIFKLLYMIVTYQNKALYNKVYFGTSFTNLLMFSCIHVPSTHPKFNHENYVLV